MTEEDTHGDATTDAKDITAPPGGKTHEATTPPGQGERDEEAIRQGVDRLEQAGGGH